MPEAIAELHTSLLIDTISPIAAERVVANTEIIDAPSEVRQMNISRATDTETNFGRLNFTRSYA